MQAEYDVLKQSLVIVQKRVATVTWNYGLAEELNEVAGWTIPLAARQAAVALRTACQYTNVVSLAALFAELRFPTDVGFRAFEEAFRRAGFIEYCCRRSGRYENLTNEKVAGFLSTYEASLPSYAAIKPVRDKALAHISRTPFGRPTVKHINDLARNSATMTRELIFIFGDLDVDMSTFKTTARMKVRALMRSRSTASR
jgi:hypothetical protein